MLSKRGRCHLILRDTISRKITSEWFAGTVREAIDESMARNKKDRLNVPQADRLEEAWKRVLLGGWSKKIIVQLCGVGDGTVANMRRVVEAASAQDKFGRNFRKRLGGALTEKSWSIARMTYANIEPEKITDEQQAEKLARRLAGRMTNLLSREPRVTAKALAVAKGLAAPTSPKPLERLQQPQGSLQSGRPPDG